MKNLLLLLATGLFCLFVTNAAAQADQEEPEQLNLPGDNLNLYAVMKLFQESPTLEEFEKKLNDESNQVNNLDLDGDGQTDYIKVVDNADGETHNIALRVSVNKDEDQDVAVFDVHKDRNGQVAVQLIGDEDLYGKDYIIEPDGAAPTSTPNPGYAGNEPPPVDLSSDTYEVSAWPVVQFIYVPSYTAWRSPWHWGYYPSYWHPWQPLFWHEYYGYHYHWNYFYRAHYRYTPVYRYPAWREHYYGGGIRVRSTYVETRVRTGNYRQTYSRPDLANRGAGLFKREHPNAPHVNRPLPRFDNNNNNRPIVSRPVRDANRPMPGNNNRPVTRPVNPGNSNLPSNRPGTRPAYPNTDRPLTRPVTPDNGNKPGTRPVNPRPISNGTPNRPITRPVNPNPSHDNTTPNRPVTRPANPNPVNGNNTPARPIIKPNPAQPSNPRPNNGNFPNRPVTRPAAPRPQQVQQPANRPAANPGGAARPRRDNP